MYKLNCLATFMKHDSLLNFRSVFLIHPVQKDQGPIFLCKDQASEVNKKFIIWHL